MVQYQQLSKLLECRNVIIFLPVDSNICFGHFDFPQYMFKKKENSYIIWLRGLFTDFNSITLF